MQKINLKTLTLSAFIVLSFNSCFGVFWAILQSIDHYFTYPSTTKAYFDEKLEQAKKMDKENDQYELAGCYADGFGTDPDYQEAATWFNKAYAHGNSKGAFELGMLHLAGLGVKQDLDKTKKLFNEANKKTEEKDAIFIKTYETLYMMLKNKEITDKIIMTWGTLVVCSKSKAAAYCIRKCIEIEDTKCRKILREVFEEFPKELPIDKEIEIFDKNVIDACFTLLLK